MRYGIPLLGQRVAPRITAAESILLVTIRNNQITNKELLSFEAYPWINLQDILASFHIDTLVCNGVDQNTRRLIESNTVSVIENVACDMEGVIQALATNSLFPGYGFHVDPVCENRISQSTNRIFPSASGITAIKDEHVNDVLEINCIDCVNRICLHGQSCPSTSSLYIPETDANQQAMLDSASDISLEVERTLCRISELVYFCIEMKYRKIGIAFCADLLEAADILTNLLRRYFEVYPVICKVGGLSIKDPLTSANKQDERSREEQLACNPLGQAEILNRIETDINVIVGLCMGVDCVFTKASQAPVTTLLVKDKSLANNPIGALYSEYYIKEVTQTPTNIS